MKLLLLYLEGEGSSPPPSLPSPYGLVDTSIDG